MRHFFLLVTFLLAPCTVLIADELPPQAVEVTKGLDQESDLIRSKLDVEFTGKRDLATQKLQVIQDKYTRDAKLDPAVAVRDLIRSLKANNSYVQSGDLPTEAVEITKKTAAGIGSTASETRNRNHRQTRGRNSKTTDHSGQFYPAGKAGRSRRDS